MNGALRLLTATTAGLLVVCAVFAAHAQTSSDPVDPVIQEHAREKARAEAARAAAEAGKAETDAAVARAMAAANALPKSDFGQLTPGTGAGLAEARLLNAVQIGEVTRSIATDFCAGVCADASGRRAVVVISGRTRPSLALARQFNVTLARVERALEQGAQDMESVNPKVECLLTADPVDQCLRLTSAEQPDAGITGAVVEASGAFHLLARLGGLFARDITITGADMSGDDTLVAIALANRLSAASDVFTDSGWMGVGGNDAVGEALAPLMSASEARRSDQARLGQAIERLKTVSAALPAGTRKNEINDWVGELEAVKAVLVGALAVHDSLIAWLSTPNAAGVAPMAQVSNEMRLLSHLNRPGAVLVHVHVHSAASSAMSERSLWTFLGSAPFSVAASTVITAEIVDPLAGRTLGANAFVCDSDYTRMANIHRRLRATTSSNASARVRQFSQCHRVSELAGR
ncbi:hypothetical protein [Terricaulis sp.]|uniref:hypothetical protein n=1 Tax=Terricaulis sp. TaxID=2768686 RepID=UPI002AC5B0FD|nr:hypothetical protein [Terricaulis sp.]MDZ4690034.1 hypothetical protein [Terricaulis sp.]